MWPRNRLITPERHEDGVENGARVVEEVGDLLVEADVVQLPVIAVVAQRAHVDVFTLQFEFTLSSLIIKQTIWLKLLRRTSPLRSCWSSSSSRRT